MAHLGFADLGWHIRRSVDALDGRLGLAGVALLFCAFFYPFVVVPIEDRLSGLREELARLKKQTANKDRLPETQDPRQELDVFYAGLVQPKKLPTVVERLHEIADDAGLFVERTQYAAIRTVDSRILRYQVTMPMKATYLEVRHFLAKVTKDIHPLSIDRITFKRQHATEPLVDTQIKMTFYVQANTVWTEGRQP